MTYCGRLPDIAIQVPSHFQEKGVRRRRAHFERVANGAEALIMRLDLVPRRNRRMLAGFLSAFAALSVSMPVGFGMPGSQGSTRLQPVATQSSKGSTSSARTRGAESVIDTARRAALLELYRQMIAGVQFSEQEAIILNRFGGDREVSELEADVVVSRALYAYYVAKTDLTKTQEILFGRYSTLMNYRASAIADLKAEVARQERSKGEVKPPDPRGAPANDQCAGAIVIPGAGPFPALTPVTADISDATSTGDPVAVPSCAFAGGPVSRSTWYAFTPSATASYTISACADSPTSTTIDDTVMAIYTSAAGCVGPFTQVPGGCDEDLCGVEGLQSVITINLNSGTQYFVVVWKYGASAPLPGNTAIQLRVSQNGAPSNDTCAWALALTLNVPITGTINNLTSNDYQVAASPNCFTGSGNAATVAAGRDVVFSFVPASTGSYSFRASTYAQTSLVLYATADPCPTGTAPVTVTTTLPVGPPAPCANRQVGTAEEVFCQSLTAGVMYFVFVDETTATPGGAFTIEVNPCSLEVETNGTPATANAATCNLEGAVTPNGDVDFYSLGSFGAGSRVFAMVDGGAANNSDFDLRVTSASDTLEFDDANNDGQFGPISPNVAGAKVVADAPIYARVNHFAANVQSSPYRVLYTVQPGGAGLDGTSATPESEPNDTTTTASAAANYYYSGSTSSGLDVDLYRFKVSAGDLVFVSFDGDPTLTAGDASSSSPINGSLAVLTAAGVQLVAVDDGLTTSSTTSSAASLTATTPSKPSEAIAFRAPTSGVYFVRVKATSAGDYLLSVSVNCLLGTMCTIACSSDIAVNNDPNQCGASVSYPEPTTTSDCGLVACVPASGSFFQVGTTTVTCTAQFGPTCSFDVTVNDTQPPTIACPTNITTTANAQPAPGSCTIGRIVTYPSPTTSDNCPGSTVVCAPASGSFFPVGTTTVNCTVTDASTSTALCSFVVTVNNPGSVCFRDDSTGDTFFEVVDSSSPLFGFWRYRTGAGAVYCAKAEFTNYQPGRSLVSWNHANSVYYMDTNANLANRTATVQLTVLSTNQRFTLRDSNTTNNPPCPN
jgi:hypothetical protein